MRSAECGDASQRSGWQLAAAVGRGERGKGEKGKSEKVAPSRSRPGRRGTTKNTKSH